MPIIFPDDIRQHGRILLNRKKVLNEPTVEEPIWFDGILQTSLSECSLSIGNLAVRSLNKTFSPEIVCREKIALEMTETKENIVDLVAIEADDMYHYIAYRQCFTSLKGLLKRNDWESIKARENFRLESILLDAARGICQLHKNSTQFGPAEFIHQNIRPQNILIYEGSKRYVAKISNLLMSELIPMGSVGQSEYRNFSDDVCLSYLK